jgi:hypothetical protein
LISLALFYPQNVILFLEYVDIWLEILLILIHPSKKEIPKLNCADDDDVISSPTLLFTLKNQLSNNEKTIFQVYL